MASKINCVQGLCNDYLSTKSDPTPSKDVDSVVDLFSDMGRVTD